MLVKNPGFSFIAMASIAIGVGANAAMFSVADTIVLRPLTASRPSEIFTVTAVVPNSGFASPTSSVLSYPDYVSIRDENRSFASLMAYRLVLASFADRVDQPPQRKFGLAASGTLFDTLGVQPALGRPFGVEEDRVEGRDAVVVLDHDMWERQFSSDRGILGRRIRIGGVEMSVIGVMPKDFTGPDQFVRPDYYFPAAMLPRLQSGNAPDELTRRDLRNFIVKGRLRPDAPLARARQEVALLGASLEKSYPDTNRNRGLTVRTEFDARVTARPPLAVMATMLMTLALVVLFVACANVAGLLASRAPVRAREMALRMAIGAGRLRLTRQLISESLLIAVGGGVFGLAIGGAIIAMFQQLKLPTDVPLKFDFALDQRVVLVGLGVASMSALLSSLVPAWRSTRVDLVTSLKNPTGADARRLRLWGRNTLVCGQVALSLVLLTVAVFLYRSFQAEFLRGPGFRTDHVLMMTFDPELASYTGPRTEAFYQLLTERAKTVPGVKSVTVTSSVHMDQVSIENTGIVPEGFQFPPGTDNVRIRSARIDDGFFDTIGIPIVRGRTFRSTDRADAPRVAVVNETLAARYWPGQVVIGKRFRMSDGDRSWVEIVGVVANAKYRSLSEAPTEFIYYPRTQNPAPQSTLLVATDADAAALAPPLRETIRAIDPNMPVFEVRTMEEFYAANTVFNDVLVRTVSSMGSMGLVMAMVGLYGLVAYAASRRTREIGVRMAVGANPGSVLRMVLRQGMLLAVVGSVLGVVGSVAIGGLLRGVFPGAGSIDLGTYLVVVPTLLAVTLLAAYIPARRAARIDPLMALRQE